MVVNGAAIRAASIAWTAIFLDGFSKTKPFYPSFVMEVMSTAETEEHHIPGGLPQMREWVGDRQAQNLRRYTQSIKNRHYELTLAVDRDLFVYDKLGLINNEFKSMGVVAKQHPDKLFASLLEDGFTNTGYDGVAFFSDDHPLASGTVSNKSTTALSQSSFEAAWQKLRRQKNFHGEPLDIFSLGGKPVLIVPPELEATAESILKVKQLESGADNPNYGKAEIRVNSRLTSTARWYLAIADAPLSPFIFQMHTPPEIVPRDQPNDDCVFNKNQIEYGVDGRWAMGYGLFSLIIGSTGGA